METDLDRYELYERCVQCPVDLVPLLRAIHGNEPRTLGEDFGGTGAVSRAWVESVDGGRAIVVDHDPEPLRRLGHRDAITVVTGDVRADTDPARHRADVIWVGNFSIGEWHRRDALLAYLRHARARLNDGGLFACDLYGGESAFLVGTVDRDCPVGDGRIVRYTWEQVEADPATGMVVNELHFAVHRGDRIEREHRGAFRYRWRLWGVPELRDAMSETGFRETRVYRRVPDAIDEAGAVYVTPVAGPGDLDDSFDVIVAAF